MPRENVNAGFIRSNISPQPSGLPANTFTPAPAERNQFPFQGDVSVTPDRYVGSMGRSISSESGAFAIRTESMSAFVVVACDVAHKAAAQTIASCLYMMLLIK